MKNSKRLKIKLKKLLMVKKES